MKNGRFAEYRRRIEDLLRVLSTWREGGLPPEREAQFQKEGYQYVVALSEAYELSEIVSSLSDLAPEGLRAKFGTILKGPVLPGQEDATSNSTRNFFFELITAARLKDAGMQPQLGEHPDVLCNIAGTEVLFECKRPFSEPGIGNCTAGAWRQFLSLFDASACICSGDTAASAVQSQHDGIYE